jgi:hypothetical protein
MTHTPSPWIYETGCPGHYAGWEEPEEPDIPPAIYAEVDGNTIPICTLDDPIYYAEHCNELDQHDDGMRRIGSADDNGHLIVAAPDLLAACEAALDWTGLDGDGIDEPVRSQLMVAIRKAKGEL